MQKRKTMKQNILLRTLCLLLAFIIGFSSLPIGLIGGSK